MLTVLGYADRESVRVGEEIAFYVSTRDAEYAADVVRLHCPEVLPTGPPFRETVLDSPASGRFRGSWQELRPGSYATVDRPVAIGDAVAFRLGMMPTLAGGRQTVVSLGGEGVTVELVLDEDARLCLEVVAGGEVTRLCCPEPLEMRRWVGVVGSARLSTGEAALHVRSRGPQHLERRYACSLTGAFSPLASPGRVSVSLAATVSPSTAGPPPASGFFNGRLERVSLLAQPLPGPAAERIAEGAPDSDPGAVHADWDFTKDPGSERVLDISGGDRHATLVNLPARCVKSSNWSGRSLDWRYAPEEYAAVHFHADDLADAGWDVGHRLTIPADWESGCYALRLRDSSGEWHVPFFVRPPEGAPVKDVAYLVPTCTYAAYANLHLRIWARFNELNHGRLTVLDETDLLLLELPELGKSTYDAHSDGSAVFYSSMRRPVTNFRPKGRIYKLCQDLLLVDWLEHEGIGFDVVTDEDLHREGLAALSGYRVVIAAPHPEYYTRRMLDSLEEYLGQGGRLMVLGGNTFWWATEYHPLRTGTVEVRRPGLGMLWSADLSEGGFSFSGEPGGPWRKVGRPPEVLAGSGFITQGFDECRPYHRRADALRGEADGRWGFVLEGVEGDTIGDHGILMGGAAGYEIDRASYDAGTPRHATVLASSDDHSNIYQNVIEVLEDKLPATREGAPDPVRADIVVFDTAGGGAVFSVGSIAWSGSLATNDYENDVSRITANVLRRFLDPAAID